MIDRQRYSERLQHNFHELNHEERILYNRKDRIRFTDKEQFFFEGCLDIPGQMYRADRRGLYDAIIKYEPRHCFEIGTGSGGGSTFFLASAFAELGQGKVYTLEIDKSNTALRNYQMFLSNLLPFVEFVTGDSPSLFLPFIDDSVDCVFLDGAEDRQQTLDQYEFFKPYFRPGSILMAHDWNTAKMELLKPVLENSPDWEIEVELGQPESVGFVVARYQYD